MTITRLTATLAAAAAVISARAADARADDRGGITPQTVVVAVFAALAITVGAIITAVVVAKANSISL